MIALAWLVAGAWAADVQGAATPAPYAEALRTALTNEFLDRPEVTEVSFTGQAKGSPFLGTTASAELTVTCDGSPHQLSAGPIRTSSGSGSWSTTAAAVVQRLLQDDPCAPEPDEAPAPGPGDGDDAPDSEPGPEAPDDDDGDAIEGFANPPDLAEGLTMALQALRTEHPEISKATFSAGASGTIEIGATVQASITFTCADHVQDVRVEGYKTKPLQGSWQLVARQIVLRLYDDIDEGHCGR